MQLRKRMRYELAQFLSLNNQPDMSGDPTQRLSPLQSRNLDRCIDSAIKAMFDHLEANVSEGIIQAGMDAIDSPYFADLEMAFRAMIQQARKEWEDGK